ncbi:VWA domain-containing protein [bacterium]|nr:VWA domain-containing protein [bacterium]
MKLNKTLLLICSICFLFGAQQAFGYEPLMYKVIIDASGSVSEQDFRATDASVAEFVNVLYERSQLHPGETAEFISISWFGSQDKFLSTPFYNCSHYNDIEELKFVLNNASHPGLGSTAIYTAIARGANELLQAEKALGRSFPKFLILMTDGEDTDSPNDHKRIIKQLFPNNEIYLAVVGIGSANVGEFNSFADHVQNISNVEEFYALLVLLSEIIGNQ